jgi:ATP-dependent DNA helicase RecG
MALHINIEDLLSANTVESDRIEFKEGWNHDAIYRSICAFANDFDNIGGGYILVGVAENPETKVAIRPVVGLSTNVIGDIQSKMIGFNNLMKPRYAPKFSIETVDGKQIVVLWVIAGSERPYEVPENIGAKQKTWKYYIRRYASSIEATGADKEELIALSNNIPFDDRVNTQASVNDLSMLLVHDHLRRTGSKLAEDVGKLSNLTILQQMELVSGPAEHVFPRNVALMLFCETPEKFFPNTRVEIIHFPEGVAGEKFTEEIITGPVQMQITKSLNYIRSNFIYEQVTKVPGQAEALRVWNYPFAALEEAVANCLYHRNYQEREPVKIRIEPDAIILHNCGGPDRSIRKEDFDAGKVIPKRYRNRRLGDFFKELHLAEGHATGLSTINRAMKNNGSPAAIFEFDDERSWFQVTLPLHHSFKQVDLIPDVVKAEDTLIPIGEELIDLNDSVIQIIKGAPHEIRDKVREVAGDKAGEAAAKELKKRIDKNDESAAAEIIKVTDREIVEQTAIDAQEFVKEKMEKILMFCRKPKQRKDILQEIGLKNHIDNYNLYVSPLVTLDWLRMTIPDKPTSPNQQYAITLKGMIVRELLNVVGEID